MTDDLTARAKALTAELDELPKRQANLARERRALLVKMRETMSAQQIADALGMSRARVYELLRS